MTFLDWVYYLGELAERASGRKPAEEGRRVALRYPRGSQHRVSNQRIPGIYKTISHDTTGLRL